MKNFHFCRNQFTVSRICLAIVLSCSLIMTSACGSGVTVPKQNDETDSMENALEPQISGSSGTMEVTVARYGTSDVYATYDGDGFKSGLWLEEGVKSAWVSAREVLPDTFPVYESVMQALLADPYQTDIVFSPLSFYQMVALMACFSEGRTRDCLLSLMGKDSMEKLTDTIQKLWEGSTYDTPLYECRLGNAVVIQEGMMDLNLDKEALEETLESVHAVMFSGSIGTERLKEAVNEWLSEQLGQKSTEFVFDADMNTNLAFLSTLSYQAPWGVGFFPEYSRDGVFHGSSGDQDCVLMNGSFNCDFYEYPDFTAVGIHMQDNGVCYFVLPNDDLSLESIAQEVGLFQMLSGTRSENSQSETRYLHVSIPRITTRSETDLRPVLEQMGAQEVLNQYENSLGMGDQVVTSVTQACELTVDEKGIGVKAVTGADLSAGGASESFIVDRPFLLFHVLESGALVVAAKISNL